MRGATQDIVDTRIKLAAIGRATEIDATSDHVPISLILSCPRDRPLVDGPIPIWVANHIHYMSWILRDIMSEADNETDINEQLAFFKVGGLKLPADVFALHWHRS